LSAEIEHHLGSRLRGQHLTVRMETDLKTRKLTLSFQPEVLPKLQSASFMGNEKVASAELASVLNPIVANSDYTDRKFAAAVELNLRPIYEQHGYYRVKFAPNSPQMTETGVSVSVVIMEGAPYQLGKVELIGDNLPIEAMTSAAKLPEGSSPTGSRSRRVSGQWRRWSSGQGFLRRPPCRTGPTMTRRTCWTSASV
jgi:outer membrane protein assembly factor BamA